MQKNTYIKSLSAGLMLIIFSFSITPRIFFHNWLASHKDARSNLPAADQHQVGHVFYNCNCDNIVAESPFTQQDDLAVLLPVQCYAIPVEATTPAFYSAGYFLFSLRGPPSVS